MNSIIEKFTRDKKITLLNRVEMIDVEKLVERGGQ